MTPWILVPVSYAQENAPPAQAETPPAPEVTSETVQDPGAIPEGGFIGNDAYGAIPLGSGWGYVWAVYIVTWLTFVGYAGYLALRNRSAQ